MNRIRWICQFKLGCQNRYFLWYSGKKDRVFLNPQRKVKVFSSRKSVLSFAKRHSLQLAKVDLYSYDFNRLSKWLMHPTAKSIRPNIFLSYWNIFDDVAFSTKHIFDPNHQKTKKVYEKLFFGSNLPSVNRSENKYHPTWSLKEVNLISQVLQIGMDLFKEKFL